MSAFGGLYITDKGKDLQAKAQTGTQLNFSRIAVGNGELGETNISDLNALISEVMSLPIISLKTMSDGKASVGMVLSNQDVTTGFYFKELGVFAQDPDEGEILYCYGNAGAHAEYIPAGGGADVIEKKIDIITVIGNASDVSAVIDKSLVHVTVDEFNNLAGEGRSTETVKQNADDIAEISTTVTSHLAENAKDDGAHGLATTNNLTYYVDVNNGSDSNNGTSSGTAFKTISKALDVLPIFLKHNVTINVADGVYDEDVTVGAIMGNGVLKILGNTENPSSCKVSSFTLARTLLYCNIQGFEVTATDRVGFYLAACSGYIQIQYCQCLEPSPDYAGIHAFGGSTSSITSCTFSNRKYGIHSEKARVYSGTNTGSDNENGLCATEAGSIGKFGSQPGGSKEEYTGSGGVIFSENPQDYIDAHLAEEAKDGVHGLGDRPMVSTKPKTYYIDYTNGSDSNDGLASDAAFKTWAKAETLIPRFLNHYYTIYIIGDLPEVIELSGVVASYGCYLNVIGKTSTPENQQVDGINIGGCIGGSCNHSHNLTA